MLPITYKLRCKFRNTALQLRGGNRTVAAGSPSYRLLEKLRISTGETAFESGGRVEFELALEEDLIEAWRGEQTLEH